MSKVTSVLAAFSIAALAFACSSSSTTPSPTGTSSSGGSSGETASSSGATDSSDGGASSGTATATVAAPQLTEIMKMMGALHVNWTNKEPACDSIEGEREAKMADGSTMEKFKVVFTVPGDADNKMDSSATDDMTYTYRLRCKKGSTYSDYSNEMSANPMK